MGNEVSARVFHGRCRFRMAGMSVARVYANANESRGREWWDYDNLALQWGTQDNFEIL